MIDGPLHHIDSALYLSENNPVSTPRKSLTHVSWNLLERQELGELEGLTFKTCFVGAILVSAVPFGAFGNG